MRILKMQVVSSMSEERVQEEGEEVAEEVVEEGKHNKHAKNRDVDKVLCILKFTRSIWNINLK